jgi:hypothetical protein
MGKIYKPSLVTFGDIPIPEISGGVTHDPGVATVADNKADSRVGEGKHRISGRVGRVTLNTVAYNEDLETLRVHGTQVPGTNQIRVFHNREGLVLEGDLVIMTAMDDGAAITFMFPSAQNITGGSISGIGSRTGDYSPTLALTFATQYLSSAAGDGYTLFDRTPTA